MTSPSLRVMEVVFILANGGSNGREGGREVIRKDENEIV